MMSGHDSVTLICHETQMLRLRGAELESRAINTSRELEEALARRRVLMDRLRETQKSLWRIVGEAWHRTPQEEDQRGSAR